MKIKLRSQTTNLRQVKSISHIYGIGNRIVPEEFLCYKRFNVTEYYNLIIIYVYN